jgi:hypothetical protein
VSQYYEHAHRKEETHGQVLYGELREIRDRGIRDSWRNSYNCSVTIVTLMWVMLVTYSHADLSSHISSQTINTVEETTKWISMTVNSFSGISW